MAAIPYGLAAGRAGPHYCWIPLWSWRAARGPPFALLVLAVVCASVSFELQGTLLYTLAAVSLVAVIEPTLSLWSTTAGHIRELGVRLVILAVVGIGATILARYVRLQEAVARSSRDEAERLAEIDQLRGSFVAMVSHDLQTPLAAMRASLGVLGASAAGRLEQEERGLLDSAQRNNQLLGFLIDDLLALSLLEAGALHLDLQPLDLRAVAADAIGAIHPLVENKGQILEVELASTPVQVCGDARRLGQVVVNLLQNAHRHTPAGTRILIHVSGTADRGLLSVSDNGPGIEPAELVSAFRRFRRLSEGAGSGLGLAIARELVERHNGQVALESCPRCGTTSHVTLPRLVTEDFDDTESLDR